MLTRDEVLEEMGLGPLWMLPGHGVQNMPSAVAVNGSSAAVDAGRTVAAAPGDGNESSGSVDSSIEEAWSALLRETAACRACGLCKDRTQAVPGVGDRAADWLFVGEGPGVEEDRRGEPFVGPAGQLLDAMLAAIGLERGKGVYIANAVKCRPPQNRTPTPEEIAACRPFLERQIALLKPRLIVLLGKAAAQSVLGRDEAMVRLRGQDFDYRGIPVVATYHPAYYLRSPLEKSKAWEDLCRARQLMRAVTEGS